MYVRSSETRVILSENVDDKKWLERSRMWLQSGRNWWHLWTLTNPHHFLITCTWDALSGNAKPNETSIEQCTKLFESRISAGSNRKLLGWEKHQAQTVAWSYDMEGHAQKCVERFCELANKKVEQLYKVSSPCLDDDLCKQEELESVVEISQVCSHNFWECLYLARDDLTSCGPWTSLQDQSRNGLRHGMWQTTSKADFVTIVMWKNTEQHCGPGLFQDSDFAGDLEDSKINLRRCLCFFWKYNIRPSQLDVQETNFGFAQL